MGVRVGKNLIVALSEFERLAPQRLGVGRPRRQRGKEGPQLHEVPFEPRGREEEQDARRSVAVVAPRVKRTSGNLYGGPLAGMTSLTANFEGQATLEHVKRFVRLPVKVGWRLWPSGRHYVLAKRERPPGVAAAQAYVNRIRAQGDAVSVIRGSNDRVHALPSFSDDRTVPTTWERGPPRACPPDSRAV